MLKDSSCSDRGFILHDNLPIIFFVYKFFPDGEASRKDEDPRGKHFSQQVMRPIVVIYCPDKRVGHTD